MSKDKNLIIVIFLAFSFAVASASFYFGMPKQSNVKDVKPTVLGITGTTVVSSSSTISSQSKSAESSQKITESTQLPVASNNSSNQGELNPVINEEKPSNRGNWEQQQGAYSN